MFVGHLALALAAKRADRATPLVWYVAGANLVDLVWPLLLIAGVERVRIEPGATAFTPLVFEHYPWTHSLLMGIIWGVVLAAFGRWRGVSVRGATIAGALVVSHWALDLLTHAPDLPLWPGGATRLGLGLWDSVVGTYVVESLLWLAGIALFLSVRRMRGAQGHVAFWSFVLVSTLIWAPSPFAPPPSDERALAFMALLGWSIVPWAIWIERTSEERSR
jgi:hypothetical protein